MGEERERNLARGGEDTGAEHLQGAGFLDQAELDREPAEALEIQQVKRVRGGQRRLPDQRQPLRVVAMHQRGHVAEAIVNHVRWSSLLVVPAEHVGRELHAAARTLQPPDRCLHSIYARTTMEYRLLSGSGLKVPVLSFGMGTLRSPSTCTRSTRCAAGGRRWSSSATSGSGGCAIAPWLGSWVPRRQPRHRLPLTSPVGDNLQPMQNQEQP